MTYEERKRWLCQQCGKPHQCGYVNRGLEDDCTALQEWMQCWELGYQDAVGKAYKWLIERYDNQGVILIDDIRELYDKMDEL